MKKLLFLLSFSFLAAISANAQTAGAADTIKTGVGEMRINSSIGSWTQAQITTFINTAIGGAPATDEAASVISTNNRHFDYNGTDWLERASKADITGSKLQADITTATKPKVSTEATNSGIVTFNGANDVSINSSQSTTSNVTTTDITVSESTTNEGITVVTDVTAASTTGVGFTVHTENKAGTQLGDKIKLTSKDGSVLVEKAAAGEYTLAIASNSAENLPFYYTPAAAKSALGANKKYRIRGKNKKGLVEGTVLITE